MAVGQGDLERVILEILEIAEHELRSVSVSDLRRGIAASIACRAAIKINTPLDQRKMEWMLRTLAATDYPMACPHGRPVALQYSMRDILLMVPPDLKHSSRMRFCNRSADGCHSAANPVTLFLR